jgi:hypothetical protein
VSKRDRVNKLVQEIKNRAARMSSVSEQEVRQWVEQAHGRARKIRKEMAELWRDGLIELSRTQSGDFRSRITEFGRSVGEASERKDAPVCVGCGKSGGVIQKFIVTNTKTGSYRSEWMHEECFVGLPLVQ